MKVRDIILMLCIAALVAMLGGCALVPSSKTTASDGKSAGNATSQHETTLRRVTEGVLPANITITIGKGGVVTMPPPPLSVPMSCLNGQAPYKEDLKVSDEAGLSSASSFSWSKFNENVIPWGIRLCLAALGILLLIWVVKYLRRSSPSVDAILSTADHAIAARINRHREDAISATDPAIIAQHNARIAALQEERVNLIKARP